MTYCTQVVWKREKNTESPKKFEFSNAFKNISDQFIEKRTQSQFCHMCTSVVETVQTALKANEEFIENIDRRLCHLLPKTLTETCNTLALEILSFILNNSSKDLCCVLYLCPIEMENQTGSPDTLEDDTEAINTLVKVFEKLEKNYFSNQFEEKQTIYPLCFMCKIVISRIQAVLNSSSSQILVKNIVHGICHLLSHEKSAQCHTIADLIIPAIVENTAQDLCGVIKLCALDPYSIAAKIESTSNHLTENDATDPVCDLCLKISKQVETDLRNNKNLVENVIHEVCNRFPKRLSDECISSADVVIPMYLNLTSEELCGVINLCPLSNFSPKIESTIDQSKGMGAKTPGCEMCLMIATGVETDLRENKNLLMNVVRKICKTFSRPLSTQCNLLAPMIVHMILKSTPQEVCNGMSLCSKNMMKDIVDNKDSLENIKNIFIEVNEGKLLTKLKSFTS